eukprot:TRINITY_DN3435_c0_g1_i1.p1 TRINITY_DN3435_c0_g1~~TRINITY_DN3435_c0_g1_i1.p1  ORF type:complete len:221 (-),score=32.04 TRINITY_DN3435_c0_g1_i1:2230-2892(-)
MKLAPFALTKVLRPVASALRRQGMAVLAYTDDFCARPPGPSPTAPDVATATRVRVVALSASLGLTVPLTKGAIVGATALPILGYVIDTVRRLILLPPARLASLIAAARALRSAACSTARRVLFKALQRFTGKAVSCSLALPAGRLYLRRLYAAQKRKSHARTMLLTHGALRDLRWWTSLKNSAEVGSALWPRSVGLQTMDASQYGWSGTWNELVSACGFF